MASSNASNDFSLQGKGALVVGAEHSVGRAAAVTLAEAGARVVLASQEPGTDKQLKEVARLVNAAGTKPVIRVQDAATRADLSATADLAVKELGGLHILVNALDTPAFGPAEDSRRHGVRQNHGEQSEDGVDVVPGRRARDAPAGQRRHRQHHFGARGTRRPQCGAVLRGESCGPEPDARAGARMGAQGDPRQRDRGWMARR